VVNIVSIDIGLSGAISIFHDGMITSFKMPTYTEVNYAGKNRKKYDLKEISRILVNSMANDNVECMVFEAVHAFPKQGSVSNFTFGYGLGIFSGMAAALGLPATAVDPKLWKRHFDLIGREKDASIALVQNLFDIKTNSDGVADSILIGAYFIDKMSPV
jgi:crossover junction endodeoxyribonuclease RuvC